MNQSSPRSMPPVYAQVRWWILAFLFLVTVINFVDARVTGLTGVANGVSGMIFPIITGMIVDHASYLPVFFMAALMPMLGILILFATLKDYRKVIVT